MPPCPRLAFGPGGGFFVPGRQGLPSLSLAPSPCIILHLYSKSEKTRFCHCFFFLLTFPAPLRRFFYYSQKIHMRLIFRLYFFGTRLVNFLPAAYKAKTELSAHYAEILPVSREKHRKTSGQDTRNMLYLLCPQFGRRREGSQPAQAGRINAVKAAGFRPARRRKGIV